MKRSRDLGRFLLAIVVIVLALSGASWSGQKDEEQLGRDYAKEVEKTSKMSTDAALLARVQRVGAVLAKIANEQEVPAGYGSSKIIKFNYQFKVIEDNDVNAFSLPGGFVYVNTGLLKFVESDDQLAGVWRTRLPTPRTIIWCSFCAKARRRISTLRLLRSREF